VEDRTLAGFSSPAIVEAVPLWVDKLVDTSARNPLVRLADTKTTTLDLADADPAARTRLLESQAVQLTALFPDPQTVGDARTRVRNIRGRARTLREEQGVEVLYLAQGLLCWTDTGGVKVRTPVLLRAAELTGKGNDDPTIQLSDEPQVNPVLLFLLRQQYGIDLEFEPTPHEPLDLRDVVETVRVAAGVRLADLESQDRLVLGLFTYHKLPMVQDLQQAGAALNHQVIAALAGDESARAALLAARGDPLPNDPDRASRTQRRTRPHHSQPPDGRAPECPLCRGIDLSRQ